MLAVVSLTVNSATTYYETLDSAIAYINALIGQDVTMTLLANCSSTTHLETNVNYIRIYAGNYTITNLYNDTTAITLLTGQITNYYGSGVNSVIIVNNSDSAKGITTSTLEDGAWLTGEEGHLGTVTASGSGTMTFNGDPNYKLYSTVCLTHNITVGTITLADEAQVNVPISITTGTTDQTKIEIVVALEDCEDYRSSSHPLIDFDGSSTIYNACKNKFKFTLPGAYGEVKDETSYCIYLELLGGTLTITSSYTGCEAIAMGFVNITNSTATRTWSIMLVANQTYTIEHIPFDTYTITAYASINHTATPYKIVNEVNTALTNSQLLINSTEGNTNVAMQVVVAKLPTSGQGTLYAGGFYKSNASNIQNNVNENSAQTEIVALNLADLLEPQVEDINLEIVETETINVETKDNRVEKQVADVQYIEEVDKDFAIQDVITDSKKDYIYRNDYIDLKNKYTNTKRYAI